MRKKFIYTLVLSLTFAIACKNETMKSTDAKMPVAEKQPIKLEKHGDVRIDNYFWMRLSDEQKNAEIKDEQTQKVINYLEEENNYYKEVTAYTKNFEEKLFQEMKGRIKEDDSSVPYKDNGYFYITRYETGMQYPIYSRKKETLEAKEEVLFNVNEMAKDFDYFQLGGLNVSNDNKLVVFATDTVSRRQYFLRIKNLETGEIYKDIIENTTGGSVWANDNKTIFYTKKNPKSSTIQIDTFVEKVAEMLAPYIEDGRISIHQEIDGLSADMIIEPIYTGQPRLAIISDGSFWRYPKGSHLWETMIGQQFEAAKIKYLPIWSMNWWKSPDTATKQLAGEIIGIDQHYKPKPPVVIDSNAIPIDMDIDASVIIDDLPEVFFDDDNTEEGSGAVSDFGNGEENSGSANSDIVFN